MTTETVSPSVAEPRSPIGAALGRALTALLVAVATLACLSVSAGATTTMACAYDDSRCVVARIDVASAAAGGVERTQWAPPSHGYDDGAQHARTSARSGGYRLAPQTGGGVTTDLQTGGKIWILPAGSPLPPDLEVVPDGRDYGGRAPTSHHTIRSTRAMPFVEFQTTYRGLSGWITQVGPDDQRRMA